MLSNAGYILSINNKIVKSGGCDNGFKDSKKLNFIIIDFPTILLEVFISYFIDQKTRDLPSNARKGTTEYCLDICKSRGYMHIGRQANDECWCGNNPGSYSSATDCNNCLSQTGNYRGWRNCIFVVGIALSHAPSSSLSPSNLPSYIQSNELS